MSLNSLHFACSVILHVFILLSVVFRSPSRSTRRAIVVTPVVRVCVPVTVPVILRESLSNTYISTVSYHRAFISWTLVSGRVFWDSKWTHSWFHARGGARGQNLGHLCNIICICVKSFQMLISRQSLITKHSYLQLGYLVGSSVIPNDTFLGSCLKVGLGVRI